ncbi:MAG TPA: hypothetical protein VF211_10220 [Burkholderiales bacterium]
MIALSIEDEHTVLGSASPGAPDIRLPVGWRTIARDRLKRGPPVLTLGAVEQAFQRLAAQASRGLRSADGLPEGNDAAAALVILRELMHHAGIPAIIVEPG